VRADDLSPADRVVLRVLIGDLVSLARNCGHNPGRETRARRRLARALSQPLLFRNEKYRGMGKSRICSHS
jgi:hypothetical protein